MRHSYAMNVLATIGIPLAIVGTANAADYNCVPLEVAVLDNWVRIQCAEPAPKTRGSYPIDKGNTIVYFAVSLIDKKDWVDRFIQTANTAIISGRPLRLSYTSGDYSGEAFGCDRSNCRKPWAITLLKTTVVP